MEKIKNQSGTVWSMLQKVFDKEEISFERYRRNRNRVIELLIFKEINEQYLKAKWGIK